MARRSGVRLTVLGEDANHVQFSRYVFLKLGYHSREIRLLPIPSGRGAGEKWVRDQFPKEVQMHRRRGSSQRVVLLVVVDADNKTVKHRQTQFANRLKEEGHPERSPNEPIIIWIPKRHIETWIAFLLGNKVNEKDAYKKTVGTDDGLPAAERFVEIYQDSGDPPKGIPDSLAKAYKELDRLPK